MSSVRRHLSARASVQIATAAPCSAEPAHFSARASRTKYLLDDTQVGPVFAHYRGVQFVNDVGLISDARADAMYNELHGLYAARFRQCSAERTRTLCQVF